MGATLAVVLTIGFPAAFGVLIYVVTADIATWFVDRRLQALQEQEQAKVAEIMAKARSHHKNPVDN